MEKRTYKIFIDFDGTITKRDVGENLFLHFGSVQESKSIIDLWMNDKITSTKCWQMLTDSVDFISTESINEFLLDFEIDPTFKDFLSFAKTNNIDVFILSDGFDYYINRILAKNNIKNLTVYSNKLMINSHGKMVPSFPTTDEVCDKCANCKRNHIINNSGDDEYTIYIGDGYSDACPVQYCDFIFAKKSLLKYCEVNRISYFPFNDFNNVKIKLEKLIIKNNLKKRKQAELKRKLVYQQG